MPALQNTRHERYAQLIVEGLNHGDPKPYSQSRAYIAAGYTAKDCRQTQRISPSCVKSSVIACYSARS